MKETEFINQNEAKWARFEQLYANNKSHPGELSDLYFDLTNDLSYSQTFYRRRTVRAYLNQLAQAVFTTVHNHKRPSVGGVFHFWFKRLPMEIHQSRTNIQMALLSFLLYAAIGALAAHFIPHFVEAILGKGYVVQTMENIKKGNPLGIYDSSSQFDMFIMIASNNLKVAFIMFSSGYLMTLGTHYFLFANGVMIGAFQYLFYSQGLLETSFLGIWMHGAFEVSAIVIAAGAGITAGKGWMFPSSYSRFEAFQLATKRAVKIMVSLVPFILLAAFIESYITHHYDVLPAWSKWLIILGSFGVILFFYFIFPLIASQKNEPIPEGLVRPKKTGSTRINVYKIRTSAELITDAFSLYRTGFTDLAKVMFGIFLPFGMVLILVQAYFYGGPEGLDSNLAWYDYLPNMFGVSKESPPQFIIYGCWTLLFAFVFAAVGHSLLKQIGFNDGKGQFFFMLRKTPLFWVGSIGLWIILIFPVEMLIITVFFLPCATYQGPLLGLDDRGIGVKLNLTVKYFFANWKPMFGALVVLVIFLFILLQPIAGLLSYTFTPGEVIMPDLLDYLAENVQNIAVGLGENPDFYAALVRKSCYLIALMFLIPYLGFLFLLNYYSILEVRELTSLKQALELFGKRKKVSEGEVK